MADEHEPIGDNWLNWLTLALQIYFAIGAIVSIPLEFSYGYALVAGLWRMGWEAFSLAGAGFFFWVCWILLWTSAVRAALWLPSFAYWLLASENSFWFWLAPGFYADF